MCDTFIFFDENSKTASGYFAKNSDREIEEIQIPLLCNSDIQQSENDGVIERNCKYRRNAIKDALDKAENDMSDEKKYEIFLSKPLWIWGAEMGVNVKGLAIGNEAVFSKIPASLPEGLLGMDVLRAALERTGSAEEALEFIIKLTEKNSLTSDGGYQNRYVYDNSFLITDGESSYVLECAGKKWAYKKLNGFRSISNTYSLKNDFDESNYEMEITDFKNYFEDSFKTKERGGEYRKERIDNFFQSRVIDDESVKAALRIHNENNSSYEENITSICRHSYAGGTIGTTASMYIRYWRGQFIIWTAKGIYPCLSIYLPFSFCADDSIKKMVSDPEEMIKKNRIYRRIADCMQKNGNLKKEYLVERDSLERIFFDRVYSESNNLNEMITKCWQDENVFINNWMKKLHFIN